MPINEIVISERHRIMLLAKSVIDFASGTPQFRIAEDSSATAPVYAMYAQTDLEDDLAGLVTSSVPSRQIRTSDAVVTASEGSVVFSLLSGTAVIVQPTHKGYLLTQNYVTCVPSEALDARYLVYLLNEDRKIRHQLSMSRQGSVTMKYTIKQLKGLELPVLPSLERQGLIGGSYLDQLKLDALRRRASKLETTLVLEAIRKAERR